MAFGVRVNKNSKTSACAGKQDVIDQAKIVGAEDGHDENGEEQGPWNEQEIVDEGQLYSKTGRAEELGNLIKKIRPFLSRINKAKADKLVRTLVDMFLNMGATTGMEVDLSKECIEWAKQENRTFLRQSLECRLIALYYDTKKFADALQLGNSLLKELKKVDDKPQLVEVQLLESRAYHGLSNLPKARTSLLSARTLANAMYCPPKLQASLDLQSGILHAADEQDFMTAYSYFCEAFEGYNSIDCPKALIALKYMLLSKIMLGMPDDVNSLVSGKLAGKYVGPEVEAMNAVAKSSYKRSMSDFQKALVKYKKELIDDPVIQSHLHSLYDKMLEQNLCRIIEPFSRVQVKFIAKSIQLSQDVVEKKLSQMILDKQLNGILDQGEGVLIIFEAVSVNKTYESALETIQSLGRIVDALYQNATKIS